jgi:hypothetical protein
MTNAQRVLVLLSVSGTFAIGQAPVATTAEGASTQVLSCNPRPCRWVKVTTKRPGGIPAKGTKGMKAK